MPWSDVELDLAFANGAVLLLGIVLYALLGGADFGGGIWDLLARGPRADDAAPGDRPRDRPDLGGEPRLADLLDRDRLLGLPDRLRGRLPPPSTSRSRWRCWGSSFAARPSSSGPTRTMSPSPSRVGAAVFAVASTATPVILGMCAGAVASGEIRVVDGHFEGSYWSTWLGPFPIVVGLLSLATCAYLAAVYLAVETRARGELEEDFRRRALGAGIAASSFWR